MEVKVNSLITPFMDGYPRIFWDLLPVVNTPYFIHAVGESPYIF